MFEKNPVWTRSRAGKNRVHWVAYDDREGAEGRSIVDQGYAPTLREADDAARAALAEAGLYRSRRVPAGRRPVPKADRERVRAGSASAEAPDKGARPARREYLFTRRPDEHEGAPLIAAHLILARTPTKVRVSRQAIGPDQIGTDDERWDEVQPRAVALDRATLQRSGSAYSTSYPGSEFYTTRDKATGDEGPDGRDALGVLGLGSPASLEDIKAAYRTRALAVHPDRGGDPATFRAVEHAYRRLVREAQAMGS